MNRTVLDAISAHKSVRAYKAAAIEPKKIREVVRIGQTASTSHNIQAYSVVKVEDGHCKKSVSEIGKQAFIEQAPVLLIVCADFYRLKTAVEGESKKFYLSGVEDLIIGAMDAALVAQNMVVASELMGLGACIIGGIRNDMGKIAALLKLPELVLPLVGICLGYPAAPAPVQKPRFPLEAVLHDEHYRVEGVEVGIQMYNQTMKTYYSNRGETADKTSWSGRMCDYFSMPRRTTLLEAIGEAGFKLK